MKYYIYPEIDKMGKAAKSYRRPSRKQKELKKTIKKEEIETSILLSAPKPYEKPVVAQPTQKKHKNMRDKTEQKHKTQALQAPQTETNPDDPASNRDYLKFF
ncbi:hypothetical protein BB561_005774 [Smittium simulii]|uniref:Uncharacterized protein n=1 Tax=Smittium simulii TaxID=133385 RepID=A0A2T9Y8C0_9FUNG|nr:hypothetical protein BB561_005774 [Smittium simulii]